MREAELEGICRAHLADVLQMAVPEQPTPNCSSGPKRSHPSGKERTHSVSSTDRHGSGLQLGHERALARNANRWRVTRLRPNFNMPTLSSWTVRARVVLFTDLLKMAASQQAVHKRSYVGGWEETGGGRRTLTCPSRRSLPHFSLAGEQQTCKSRGDDPFCVQRPSGVGREVKLLPPTWVGEEHRRVTAFTGRGPGIDGFFSPPRVGRGRAQALISLGRDGGESGYTLKNTRGPRPFAFVPGTVHRSRLPLGNNAGAAAGLAEPESNGPPATDAELICGGVFLCDKHPLPLSPPPRTQKPNL
ncbi:hypothetical protein SKAU_G00351710 [Synaphobranchus kaupii]|uniref:Uncharacterized protein n=1 Tax=Synaphobranchus kaupii TaxID=118154 RepID=A0A9Q1EKM9_SYNKA|nr:hypothetical protein SKAU_G00351710 [Synaphobranchus kaupii]